MDNLAREINESIKASDLYNRYLICKSNVEKNEELKEFRNLLDSLKETNCKNKNEKLINEYYEIERKYKSHPIVKEYDSLKKEVYELLASVSDILSFN